MLHFFSEGTMAYQEAWGFHFHVKPCCKKNLSKSNGWAGRWTRNKQMVVFGSRHWFKMMKLKLLMLLRRSPAFS